jgi:protein XRP2
VEVSNCANCQIFIGPVDGPAIFTGCTNVQVSVASQQFQAKGCADSQFALYCATGPSISSSRGIKISCWTGAYPGLTAHFAAASLDPAANHWQNVYDASAPLDGPPNYTMDPTPSPAWEVPLEGIDAPPDNPVPGPDGAAYAYAPPAVSAPLDDAFFGGGDAGDTEAHAAAFPAENGHGAGAAAAAAPPPAAADTEPPSTAAARERLSARLAAQAREEAEKKAAATTAAAAYLRQFYEARSAARAERLARGRAETGARGGAAAEAGPEGRHPWERAISMIDFNAARPSGTDLSRFKSVLLAAKGREAEA